MSFFDVNEDYVMDKVQTLGERVLAAAFLFIVGLIAIKLVLLFLDRASEKSRLDKIISNYLHLCVKAVLFVLLAMIVLSTLGVSVVSLIAVLSAAAAAVALGLQSSLSSLAAGILIIVNKPFTQGDYIESAGQIGVVDEIHLFNCRLHTLDNKFVVVPNSTLVNSVIVNCSHLENRRVNVKVGVSYGEDIDKVRRVLLEVAAGNDKILQEPAPFVGVASQGDSLVEIDFFVWCKNGDYLPVLYYVQEAVLKRFKQENIEIPFPQLDVHFDREAAN